MVMVWRNTKVCIYIYIYIIGPCGFLSPRELRVEDGRFIILVLVLVAVCMCMCMCTCVCVYVLV
ncbi:hypothetical protein F4809DRAFT_615017 [Biscogniauxia mediterranea]|nr:hypothetical protein F4809DRAFT_615017 [Biscogniauxia mediterranea]